MAVFRLPSVWALILATVSKLEWASHSRILGFDEDPPAVEGIEVTSRLPVHVQNNVSKKLRNSVQMVFKRPNIKAITTERLYLPMSTTY